MNTYMLRLLSVVSTFLISSIALGQRHPDEEQHFGPTQYVTSYINHPLAIFPADLDGDGDVDLLATTKYPSGANSGQISWFENMGRGVFASKKIIASAPLIVSIVASDLDGDGDMDVLSASKLKGRIAWYENLGSGSFGPVQVITDLPISSTCVYATDLDGDGAPDVLAALQFEGKIVWHKNRLNTPTRDFGSQNIITTSAKYARAVYAKDLDGDGDPDVLSASKQDAKIAWYENLGGGSFGPQQIISTGIYWARCVYAEDLDGDGDADVLAASFYGFAAGVVWFENLGGGMFGPKRTIDKGFDGVWSIHAADLDQDGDADVMATASLGKSVAWYKNDGSGHFGAPIFLTRKAKGAKAVYPADFDGDGDLDIVAASMHDKKIRWWRNLLGRK